MPLPRPVAGFQCPKANNFVYPLYQIRRRKGGLDHGAPKFIMLNNAKLKDTLSQKVSTTTTDPVLHQPKETVDQAMAGLQPSLTVGLTFSLSLDDAQSQMKRIQEMIHSLGLKSTVQHVSASSSSIVPLVSKPIPLPATAESRSQAAAKHTVAPEPMTDKQKNMIFSLIARKNLASENVSDILEREFGHQDGARLTKAEASKLISRLMAK
jgi:hypothetical protein